MKVSGDIQGFNTKDSKLISKRVKMESLNGKIFSKRLRNDNCEIKTFSGDILIGSYLESGILDVQSDQGSILVNKRLGLN